MRLKPCQDCPHKKEPCALRERLLNDLYGIKHLTTVSFTCKRRLSTLPPGTRVSMMLLTETVNNWGPYPEPDLTEEEFFGTVMRPSRRGSRSSGRILVWLDEPTSMGRNPVALHPDRVTPLDEPLVPLCPLCGQPEGTTPNEKWDCPRCRGWIEGPDGFWHEPESAKSA